MIPINQLWHEKLICQPSVKPYFYEDGSKHGTKEIVLLMRDLKLGRNPGNWLKRDPAYFNRTPLIKLCSGRLDMEFSRHRVLFRVLSALSQGRIKFFTLMIFVTSFYFLRVWTRVYIPSTHRCHRWFWSFSDLVHLCEWIWSNFEISPSSTCSVFKGNFI